MAFVIPNEVAERSAWEPTAGNVAMRKRGSGSFAVVRFSGRLSEDKARNQQSRLRGWMESKQLIGEDAAETAGCDPTYNPGFLTRNEVLIRLKSVS